MIRVTVELVPYGIEEKKQTLEVLEIANVGGNSIKGEYSLQEPNKTSWSRDVFKHWRDESVYRLIYHALKFMGHGDD